tara:strand:- start:315 stop:881 length:567 start_codon:yes stop_codon:yes gene_type:complete
MKSKKKNESMQNAVERLIADIALNRNGRNVYSDQMGEKPIDQLKFLLEGMSTGRELSSGNQRTQLASDEVSKIIRAYGSPSYQREVGMTERTVDPINRGQITRIDPDLGVKMNYPYMSQERQRLDEVRADEVKKILAELVRNPPRKTVGEGYNNGGTVKYRSGGKFPDLTGDGKVTMADILKGRGVGK